VAHVVVGRPLGESRAKRQYEGGAIQRLDLVTCPYWVDPQAHPDAQGCENSVLCNLTQTG
jgi:hypothetical protein